MQLHIIYYRTSGSMVKDNADTLLEDSPKFFYCSTYTAFLLVPRHGLLGIAL